MMRLTYKDDRDCEIEVFAGDAVDDDAEHVVLLWIMKNKFKKPLWKQSGFFLPKFQFSSYKNLGFSLTLPKLRLYEGRNQPN